MSKLWYLFSYLILFYYIISCVSPFMSDKDWECDLNAHLTKQLNLELSSFYLYLSLESLSAHNEYSLPGFQRFFKIQKKEELRHAKGIQDYATKRNIALNYEAIEIPYASSCVKDPIDYFRLSLEHEKKECENILATYEKASKNLDFETCAFLDAYVKEQSKSIKELEMMIKNLSRCTSGEGLFIFDQQLLSYHK